MQTNYTEKPAIGVAGGRADSMPAEFIPATNLAVKAFDVQVATVTNSAVYSFNLKYPSRVPATAGQTLTQLVTFTSDASATKAEILEGLRAAVAALAATIQVSAVLVDTTNGPLLVYGDVADLQFTIDGATSNLTVAENDGEIPFGVFVVRNGSDKKCRLPQVTGDIAKTMGLAVRHITSEQLESGNAAYGLGSQLDVAVKGNFFVQVEEAVDPDAGDVPYIRFAANGANTQRGAVRKSADTSTAAAVTGVKFLTAAAAGALAVVRIDL
jgi:hypothetical protein